MSKALFLATVSFCCQSLIAKEHMNFSSRTLFTHLSLLQTPFSPSLMSFFALQVNFNEKKEKTIMSNSCITAIFYIKRVALIFFELICLCMRQFRTREGLFQINSTRPN